MSTDLPGYPKTPIGRDRTKPWTRPAQDSLPVIECDQSGCGTGNYRADGALIVGRLGTDGGSLLFCSWGCVGRYAARMELRS